MKALLSAFVAMACLAGHPDVCLNGEWRLDYFPQPDEGAVRALPLYVAFRTVRATVPGNCELDLMRAGLLPEPEKGLNVRAYWPYEGYQWLYTRTFVKPELAEGQRTILRFDGIDSLADIFLNGDHIGETANMFVPHEFDVTRRLREGTNTVQVLLRSVRREAQDATVGVLGHALGGAGADGESFRKAGHMGGWDIFPRLFVSGLWRGVELEIRQAVRIDQTSWLVQKLDVGRRTAQLHVTCRVQASFRWLDRADVRLSVWRGGKLVSSRTHPFDRHHLCTAYWQLSEIEPWWPKGMGGQPLYDAKIEVVAKDGSVLAEKVEKIGMRTVWLERDDVYSKERPGRFLFKVNGEPCYIRGSNWVPVDAMHGRDRERLLSTLEMFDDLNCNMVRVWGGGVYEPDEFFDFCDAHGIMVWQDFMSACSVFPQGDDFAKALSDEAKSVVMRLRNHASLALWCGNNENDKAFRWLLGELGERYDPNDDRSSRKTLAAVVWEFDPGHAYLPSSPYLSPDVHTKKAEAAEAHLWGAREYYKVPYYTNSVAHFVSEMGYHGCPCRKSLERMMTKECVYPWTKVTGNDPRKDYHWNDEWLMKASDPRVGTFGKYRNSLMTNQLKLMFGSVPTDLDDFIFASQVLQSEAMKTFVELFRSQKFAGKSGLIWWNVRDGWPQVSDAVVDYWGERKRAYYALRNVQQDQLVMVRDDGRVFAINDTRRPVGGRVKITDRESGKLVFKAEYVVPANASKEIGGITWLGQGVLDIAYEQDGVSRKNWFLHGEPPFDLDKMKKWMGADDDRPADVGREK